MSIHSGDFTDDHWLLLVEDEGPTRLGRVLGYFVFETEAEAHAYGGVRACCSDLGFSESEDVSDVQIEIMTYADFKESYGNRMPLNNRYVPPPVPERPTYEFIHDFWRTK